MLRDLRSLLPAKRVHEAPPLLAWFKNQAAKAAKAGGELTLLGLKRRLPAGTELILPADAEAILQSVEVQLQVHGLARLQRELDSGKYLPELFAESPDMKDLARAFADPVWGLGYIGWRLQGQRFDDVDRRLREVQLQEVGSLAFTAIPQPTTVEGTLAYSSALEKHLAAIHARLQPLAKSYAAAMEASVPSQRRYVFQESRIALGSSAYWACDWLEDLREWEVYCRRHLLLLTAPAGQGKTSFLCNLLDRSLAPRSIPYVHLTGRDFLAWTSGPLETFILSDVFGPDAALRPEHYWHEVRALSRRVGKPFVIVIDGLNEHTRIAEFAVALEHMLMRLRKDDWVRVILSCRSEYFEARFGNLQAAGVQSDAVELRAPVEKLSRRQFESMVWDYFRAFGLDFESIGRVVFEELRSDPLLLRTFCEAYGERPAVAKRTLPSINNLHKDRLYQKFFQRKLDEAKGLAATASAPAVTSGVRNAVRALIAWMIGNKSYGHVPLGAIGSELQEALDHLLAQELILRRDLAASPLAPDAEVVAFTFDEMRDYLIAEYVAGWMWQNDRKSALPLIASLTDTTLTIAEGVGRFLFLLARRDRLDDLAAEIAAAPWYSKVFLDCVFDLQDDDVIDSDIESLRREFLRDRDHSTRVLAGLIRRRSRVRYPKLNLGVLFPILDQLSESQFNALVKPGFEGSGHRWTDQSMAPIDRLVDDARSLLTTVKCEDLERDDALFMLMVYLLPVRGVASWQPAADLLNDLHARCPQTAYGIMVAFFANAPAYTAGEAWNLVGDWVRSGATLPPALVALASAKPPTAAAEGDLHAQVVVQRARTLLELVDSKQVTLSAEEQELVERAADEEVKGWMKFL